MGLGNLIEKAIKQLEEEKEAIQSAAVSPDSDEIEDPDLWNYDNDFTLSDSDY
jgi:hypothetical protein